MVVSLLHLENVQNRSVSVDGSKPRKSILVNAQELNVQRIERTPERLPRPLTLARFAHE